jgi:glycosyltransferase involved in cell wall biosynthesis
VKIAIVHDWLTNMGGAERIIRIFHELFPDAPIYTMVYDKENMPKDFKEMDIRTSFIQKMPFGVKKYQLYLPFMPVAVEQFDLSEYDIVLSSSTACAKGIITRSDTLHICYCNTPMRYAWDMYHDYIKGKNVVTKYTIAFLMNYIRLWDRISADRVDYYIANSKNVASRIKKHYKRESEVIYPPVNTDYYTPGDKVEDFYLVVSRLVPYKRIDLVVEAFNKLGFPLKIIGDGSEFKRLKSLSKSNIEFLGRLSDEEVREHYRKCKAFLFPGEEDFGITPVEAQACGRPVIAYGKGGTLETVIDDQTGVFFREQTVEALINAVKYFEKNIFKFDSSIIRQNALNFSKNVFKQKIKEFVLKKYEEFNMN